MATFRVGQRVRIIGGAIPRVIGMEATIVEIGRVDPRIPLDECAILIDGARSQRPDGSYTCQFQHLAPLTDPKADAFIEGIKKLQPLKEPVIA